LRIDPYEYIAIADNDFIPGQADDALDVELAMIGIGRSKDNHITALGVPQEVRELVNDDVLSVLQGIYHRIAFHLKRRDQERPDAGHHRHNDHNVQQNIEEVIPQGDGFLVHPSYYKRAQTSWVEWLFLPHPFPPLRLALVGTERGWGVRKGFCYTASVQQFFARLNQRLFKKHLEDDEVVLLYVHTHWRLGMMRLFWPSVAFVVSWSFLVVAPFLMIFYIVAVASMLSLVWWARNFLDYYLDAWLITNQAIIDVQWHGWFHRSATKILYSDIQGVTYETKGISGTLFQFGTISVEKVSTGSTVSMENVSKPRLIATAILQNMEQYLHSKNIKDAKHIQELLSSVVSRELSLNELKSKKFSVKH